MILAGWLAVMAGQNASSVSAMPRSRKEYQLNREEKKGSKETAGQFTAAAKGLDCHSKLQIVFSVNHYKITKFYSLALYRRLYQRLKESFPA